MKYLLIWHSQYGKEEIDSFDTREEAEKMKAEYAMAYGEGYIEIKRGQGEYLKCRADEYLDEIEQDESVRSVTMTRRIVPGI